MMGYVFTQLWNAWKDHNKFLNEGQPLDPRRVFKITRRQVVELAKSKKPLEEGRGTKIRRLNKMRWTPPGANALKINVDTTVDLKLRRGAIAIVARTKRDYS